MKLNYVLLDPTGNRTVLVETPVVPASQPACAAALLAAEPSAEQVGFLSPGEGDCQFRLRMAGGEFCGNAAMSAAALWCENRDLSSARVSLRVSGAADPVSVDVCRTEAPGWQCAVTMPPAGTPTQVTLPLGDKSLQLPLMDMGGIRHLIVTEPMDRAVAEPAIRQWCALLEAPALGLMLLDRTAGRLHPLVYVPGGDTLYWEHSCASGTAAVGCWLAWRQGAPAQLRLTQPGGALEVSATPEGQSLLRGRVHVVCRGAISDPFPYNL